MDGPSSMPWPDAYCGMQALVNAELGSKRPIFLWRQLNEGKSGAYVFFADVEGTRFKGHAILKLDSPRRWAGDDTTEAQRHQMAERGGGSFAALHLPTHICSCEQAGQTVLVSSIAGDDCTNIQPLIRLGASQQKVAIQRISWEILAEWNSDSALADTPVSPQHIMSRWLGYRLDPNAGKICAFIEEGCGLDRGVKAFSLEGKWFPNPYVYAASGTPWPSTAGIFPVTGRIHGDLHGLNALVRLRRPDDYQYYLIDLALYEENTYLLYDHAYLELSYLLSYFGNYSLPRWLAVLENFTQVPDTQSDGPNVEPSDTGVLEVVRYLRGEIEHWIDKNQSGRRPDMEGQADLARVAAGLNFTNKQIGSQHRQLAFLYSAAHLGRYLDRFGPAWDRCGPSLKWDTHTSPAASHDWKAVWNAAEQFDDRRNSYILICDRTVRDLGKGNLSVLGRIKWSLVLDFDPESREDGLWATTYAVLTKHKGVHAVLLNEQQDVNYDKATTWFMAAGIQNRVDTLSSNTNEWRRSYLPNIRRIAQDLKKHTAPKQVISVVLGRAWDLKRLELTLEGLDEVFGDSAKHLVIHDPVPDRPTGELQTANTILLPCDSANLLSGLWQMYGTSTDRQVRVPSRSPGKEQRASVALTDEDYSYLSEDFEVVHRGLADEVPFDSAPGKDFYRGNEITWAELEMGVDVRREILEELKACILPHLAGSRLHRMYIEHAPGAGGTTLAKRIAWDLKSVYPVLWLVNYSPFSSDRIASLFQITQLPVLVIMEDSFAAANAADKLFQSLKARNARGVIVVLKRHVNPQIGASLGKSMPEVEAERFSHVYKKMAPRHRHEYLDQLVHDPTYRLPFFFGLYAFEEEFCHVRDFVHHHLAGLTEKSARILCFLAIVTRYAQSRMPEVVVKKWLGTPEAAPIGPDAFLGTQAASLVLQRDGGFRLLHPLIAMEVLQQLLSVSDEEDASAWKTRLAETCRDFIDWIVKIAGEGADVTQELLSSLFISRTPWGDYDFGEKRNTFSELIHSIPDKASQHAVLKQLVDLCPGQAHFWNHLGRHHSYVMGSDYHVAEGCLKEAIRLNEWDPVHYHTLGMVYRNEIKKRFIRIFAELRRGQKILPADAIEECFDLLNKAEANFRQNRKLDPSSEYGCVTHIQLLVENIEKLKRVSGHEKYSDFLTSKDKAAVWCRNKLPEAEAILRDLKDLSIEESSFKQARGASVNYVQEWETRIQALYDQFHSSLASLQRLLADAHCGDRCSLRRMIANAYYRRRNGVWADLQAPELHVVHKLMTDNINEEGSTFHDLRTWFHAYRRLNSFEILEAIRRFSNWLLYEDHCEAHYYLYMLHFVRWLQGMSGDETEALDHKRKCQSLASGKIRRTYCYEWLVTEPTWCPLRHHSECGKWNDDERFFEDNQQMRVLTGSIKAIDGPQAGTIAVGRLEAFFLPGTRFLRGRDEHKMVSFNLGFSYEGLRAWNVRLCGDAD